MIASNDVAPSNQYMKVSTGSDEPDNKAPLISSTSKSARPSLTTPEEDDDEVQEHVTTWKFVVELIFAVLFVFYVDLGFDISALNQFWIDEQFWFFTINAVAIVLSVILTFTELLDCGSKSFEMTTVQCLLLGVAYPFQLHIAFLVYLSIRKKQVHPILVATKFAEAGIEAMTSSLIQLYSIMFCSKAIPFATCELEGTALQLMMLSVASSILSVAIAFAMFDLASYGASGFPGSIPLKVSWRYLIILLFRGAEIASRLLSLSMFQFVTRPYGGWILCLVDAICVYGLLFKCGGQGRYWIPCVFSLVNPLLEKSNVLSIEAEVYYSFRFLEVIGMILVAYFFKPDNIRMLMSTYPHNLLCWILLISTASWIVLVVIIRCSMVDYTMMQKTYKWGRKRFSEIEFAVRDRMVDERTELCEQWISKLCSRIRKIIKEISDATNKEINDASDKTHNDTDKARAHIRGLLYCAANVPSFLDASLIARDETKEKSQRLSQKLAKDLATEPESRKFITCSFNLDSAVWSLISSALKYQYEVEVICHVLVDNAEVSGELLARYTKQLLGRFSEACDKGSITSFAAEETAGDEDASEVQVTDDEGHPLLDAAMIFAGELPPGMRCDECEGTSEKMWICFRCQVTYCTACCNKRRDQQMVHEESNEVLEASNNLSPGFAEQPEALELKQFITSLNKICRTVGPTGFQQITRSVLEEISTYIKSLKWYRQKVEYMRRAPELRAALELLTITVRGQASPPIHVMQPKAKVDFFEQLHRCHSERTLDAAVVSSSLAWFPAAAENTGRDAKSRATLVLTKLLPVAEETDTHADDKLVIEYIIEYVTTLGTGSVRDKSVLVKQIKDMFNSQDASQITGMFKADDADDRTKNELLALLYRVLEPENIEEFHFELETKHLEEAGFRQDLRKIQAAAWEGGLTGFTGKKCTMESMDARQKRNTAFKKVAKILKNMVSQAPSDLQRFRESCRVSLTASVIEMLHAWTDAEQFVSAMKLEDMNKSLVELLCYSCEMALRSDNVGCDLILNQVFKVMHAFFMNAEYAGKRDVTSEDVDGGGKCDSSSHDMVLSDDVPSAYSPYTCNSCGETFRGSRWFCSQCCDDYCFTCRPKEPKGGVFPSKDWTKLTQSIAARVGAIFEIDDDRASVKRLVEIYTSGTMESSDNLLKEAINKKDPKLVWMLLPDMNLPGNKSLSNDALVSDLLNMVKEKGDFRPDLAGQVQSLKERCATVLARSRPSMFKQLSQAFLILCEMLPPGPYKDEIQKCIDIASPYFDRPEEMTFKLFKPWTSPAGRTMEKRDEVSLKDVLLTAKPIIGFFLTSW